MERMDNAIHLINHYPVDSLVCIVNILTGGQRYSPFDQLGHGV